MSEFKVGQKVELTPFYKENYPGWNPGVGIVTEVGKTQTFLHAKLGKSDLGPYLAKHGKQESYLLTSFFVQFEDKICLVSDLGIQTAK